MSEVGLEYRGHSYGLDTLALIAGGHEWPEDWTNRLLAGMEALALTKSKLAAHEKRMREVAEDASRLLDYLKTLPSTQPIAWVEAMRAKLLEGLDAT